jgi:hypothetical protein
MDAVFQDGSQMSVKCTHTAYYSSWIVFKTWPGHDIGVCLNIYACHQSPRKQHIHGFVLHNLGWSICPRWQILRLSKQSITLPMHVEFSLNMANVFSDMVTVSMDMIHISMYMIQISRGMLNFVLDMAHMFRVMPQ